MNKAKVKGALAFAGGEVASNALCCGNAEGHEAARRDGCGRVWVLHGGRQAGRQAADESALQRSWLLTVANICVGNRAALDDAEHRKQHTQAHKKHTHTLTHMHSA